MKKNIVVKVIKFNKVYDNEEVLALMVDHKTHKIEFEITGDLCLFNLKNLCLCDPDIIEEINALHDKDEELNQLYLKEIINIDGSSTIAMYKCENSVKHNWAIPAASELGLVSLGEMIFSFSIVDGKTKDIPDMTSLQLLKVMRHFMSHLFMPITNVDMKPNYTVIDTY